MPLYDYTCIPCDYTFEAFNKIVDRGSIGCPKCKSTANKAVSAAMIKLNPQEFPGASMKWARDKKKLNTTLAPQEG